MIYKVIKILDTYLGAEKTLLSARSISTMEKRISLGGRRLQQSQSDFMQYICTAVMRILPCGLSFGVQPNVARASHVPSVFRAEETSCGACLGCLTLICEVLEFGRYLPCWSSRPRQSENFGWGLLFSTFRQTSLP